MKKQSSELTRQGSGSKALTKRDLSLSIARSTAINQQDVATIVQQVLDGICDALESGRHVEFREFGVFEVIERRARIGRNPKKPEETFEIPARKTVRFKPGKRMRDFLAKM